MLTADVGRGACLLADRRCKRNFLKSLIFGKFGNPTAKEPNKKLSAAANTGLRACSPPPVTCAYVLRIEEAKKCASLHYTNHFFATCEAK